MQKRIVMSGGKRYLVNVPGWEDGVGAGCPSGVAWLSDGGANWYSVQLTGLSGSLSFATPTAIGPSVGQYANDYGFQVVMANDGKLYEVSIGAGPAVTISQSPSSLQSSKPYLFLQSKTDGAYYYVSAVNNAGTITLVINDNTRMDASIVKPLN